MANIILFAILSYFMILTTCQTQFRFKDKFPEIKCGDAFPYDCSNSKYRPIDGYCNNLLKPTWGMPYTRFNRLLPALYKDGVYEPRVAKSGKPLPLARTLSLHLHPDKRVLDKKYTMAVMQFMQMVTHDILLTDQRIINEETQCCSSQGKLVRDPAKYPLCYPVMIPKNDPDFGPKGIECLNLFVRRNTDISSGCEAVNGSANVLTAASFFLDLSIVYGNTEKQALFLRLGRGGKLLYEERNNEMWPPKADTCLKTAKRCYKAGDKRINLSIHLAFFHILMLREHNRIADGLSAINPHWDDEKLYQEARRIYIASYQYITYYEWLPIILGEENNRFQRLSYNTTGYVNDYNPAVNPSTLNEILSSVARSFHSILGPNSDMVNENRDPPHNKANENANFNDPTLIEENDNYDSLHRGLVTQPQEQYDQYINDEFTKTLFLGHHITKTDGRAVDIHRSRDLGTATYNDYRHLCGFPRARKWSDFLDLIPENNVAELAKLYEDPDDVDFSVGGLLERLIPDTLIGPTYRCVMNRQFFRTRVGDRFFFENGKSGNPFTLGQLREIRKSSISKLVCDNTKIKRIQRRGFELISEKNPLVDCKSLTGINLALWKEKN